MKNQQTSNSAETNKLRYLDQIYNKEVARMKIKPLVQLKLRDRSQDDSHNSNPLQ